jgi:protein-(glutamine-N5) methyltransferase, release factor-specific
MYTTYQNLYKQLTNIYPLNEAKAIVRMVLEDRFGLTLADIYTDKVTQLSADDASKLEKIMLRLAKGEPVQYVLGSVTFCGRQFGVAPGVLIPRPETELLCEWVINVHDKPYCALQPPAPLRVLDVGTGSGCIAITLSLDMPNTVVSACDISPEALLIARDNAIRLGAAVNFQLKDALQLAATEETFDIIVSNPPYICDSECTEMMQNVLDHEPPTALFVPDDDPLRFYRAIAEYGTTALSHGGELYFEINDRFADEISAMLNALGYAGTEVRTDQFGKQRFVKTMRA